MNIFATVGTTVFDPLIESLDQGPFARSALLQIADGSYTPTRSKWIRFTDTIDELIQNADLVVCHCGAGSVFGLLQAGKVPVVVPNLTRRDKHQAELARWLDSNNYCVVAMTPDAVNEAIETYSEQKQRCVPFDVKRFFWSNGLNAILTSSM